MAVRWAEGHETLKDWSTGVVSPRPTFEGAVLSTGHSRSVRVMSDVWGTEGFAMVWTGSRIEEVGYSLDMGRGVYATVTVDATPEARAAARAWLVEKFGAEWLAGWHRATDIAVTHATSVTRGKEVKVVRGRKVPKGTVGEVIWVGAGKFGTRVGVKDAAGTVHWTAEGNVEVTHPEEFLEEIPSVPTAAEVAAHGETRVAGLEAGYAVGAPLYASWIIPGRRAA